jgi:hypothetical protein
MSAAATRRRDDFGIRRANVARHHLAAAVVAAPLDEAADFSLGDPRLIETDNDRPAHRAGVRVMDPGGAPEKRLQRGPGTAAK